MENIIWVDPPLWLPEGSIRAIIALIILLPVVYLLIIGRADVIPDWYYVLLGMVITFYFESRKNNKK